MTAALSATPTAGEYAAHFAGVAAGPSRWAPAPLLIVLWLCLLLKVLTFGSAPDAPYGSALGAAPRPLAGAPDWCALRSATGAGAGASAPATAGAANSDAPPSAPLRPHISTAFTGIYDGLKWGSEGEGSGSGSTLRYTAPTRNVLEMLVYRHGVTRFLDAPCGSAHWWPPLLARLRRFVPCFEYRGLDVVASVVEGNTAKFKGDPLTSFARADLSTAELPHGYDMSLTRDALQHLPLLDAIDVIAGIARAAPRLALFGSYLSAPGPNRDIRAGDYFLINLLKPPFSMNATRDVLDELSANEGERKFLLLYDGAYLAGLDFDAMRARARAEPFRAKESANAARARALSEAGGEEGGAEGAPGIAEAERG